MASRDTKTRWPSSSSSEMQTETTAGYNLPLTKGPWERGQVDGGKGVEHRDPSCTIDRNGTWCSQDRHQDAESIRKPPTTGRTIQKSPDFLLSLKEMH